MGIAFGVSSYVHRLRLLERTIISAFLLSYNTDLQLQSVKARYLIVLSALVHKLCTCDLQMNQSIRDKLGFAVPDMICLKL